MNTFSAPVSEDDGVVVASQQQYRKDVIDLSVCSTKQEERALVARARSGDPNARQALFTSGGLLKYVQYWASRYAQVYKWIARLDYWDIVQEGNLMLVEMLDRALEKDDPIGYIQACAKYQMRRYCARYGSLISTPQGEYSYTVDSLDVADEDDEREQPCDILEAPPVATSEPPEAHYDRLYQALDALTDKQRVVLMRLYGLGMCPQEANHELAQSLGLTHSDISCHHNRAVKTLERILSSSQANGKVYSMKQVCERFGLDRSRMYRLLKRAHIEPCAYGFYRQEDIDHLWHDALSSQA